MKETKKQRELELLHKMRNGAIKQKELVEGILAEPDNGPVTIGACNMKLRNYMTEIRYYEDEIAKYSRVEDGRI